MSQLPAAGALTATTNTLDTKNYFEDIRDFLAESLGGGPKVELTIAGGSVTPPEGSGGGVFTIDTEGNAASDDLTNIVTTNTNDGRFVWLRAENAGRVVTIKHGSGNIVLAGSVDFSFASLNAWILLHLESGGTSWAEVMRIVPYDDLGTLTSLASTDTFRVWDDSANIEKQISAANAGPTVVPAAYCAFHATPASDQSGIVTGTPTTITFGTETYDNGANFASSTFTAPATGIYTLKCTMQTSTNIGDGKTVEIWFETGAGVVLGSDRRTIGAADIIEINLAWEGQLAASTTVVVRINHNHGSNITLDAASARGQMFFSGHRVA